MHRQPDRGLRRGGPRDTVTLSAGNQDPVSRLHDALALIILESERRTAVQEYDPFIPVLIQPFAFRGCLAGGDYALDAKVPGCNQGFARLVRQLAGRQIGEYVALFDLRLPSLV